MKIGGAWINRAMNEFVWLRLFDTWEDERAKMDAYPNRPERIAVGDLLAQHIAKKEVRVAELVHASPSPNPYPRFAQMRLYTIDRGHLGESTDFFKANLALLHEANGIPILSAWKYPKQNEFIWFRGFDSLEEIKPLMDRYHATPERTALGGQPDLHTAKQEIRELESVFDPPL
jgi:hypothetical protein